MRKRASLRHPEPPIWSPRMCERCLIVRVHGWVGVGPELINLRSKCGKHKLHMFGSETVGKQAQPSTVVQQLKLQRGTSLISSPLLKLLILAASRPSKTFQCPKFGICTIPRCLEAANVKAFADDGSGLGRKKKLVSGVPLRVNPRWPFFFFEPFASPPSNSLIGLSNQYDRYSFTLHPSSLKIPLWLQFIFPSNNRRFMMQSLGIRVGLEGYVFC